MTERPIRLMLVDDHAILRQGLRSVLERERDLVVVGEASSEAEAEAVVGAVNPDVVIMDLKLSAGSDYDGLSLCAKLSGRYPDIGLLVLTTFLDEDLVVRAVHAGARGYVVKDVDTTELVRAIRAVSTGQSAFDSRSAAAVVRSLSGRGTPHQRLTDREIEVLRLAVRGLTNKQIAHELVVSPRTVQHHLAHVYEKSGRRTRAGAALWAMEQGLAR